VRVGSPSRWVLPAPVWSAPSADTYFQVSKKLGLEEPVWAAPLAQTIWPFADVVTDRENPPQNYERWSCWNWERGWFSHKLEPTNTGVEVIRFQRLDRPPYYQVTLDGKPVWWSTSGNWALLLAHELINKAAFALAGTDQVVRLSKSQI
jgi:hypothetical protein